MPLFSISTTLHIALSERCVQSLFHLHLECFLSHWLFLHQYPPVLTLLDPGYFFLVRSEGGGRFRPPMNISLRTTFEVGLQYYTRRV